MNNLKSLINYPANCPGSLLFTLSLMPLLRRLAAILVLTALLVPLTLLQSGQPVAAASRSIPLPQLPPVISAPPAPFIISGKNIFHESSSQSFNNFFSNSLTATLGSFLSVSGDTIRGLFGKTAATTDLNPTPAAIDPAEKATSANTIITPPVLPTAGAVRFDFNGDSKADLGRWQGTTGEWSIKNSSTSQISTTILGSTSSVIAPADYDGDGKTDVSVFNPSAGTWIIKRSSDSTTTTVTNFGQTGDKAVPGDYDNDGMIDLAVWRPSTGVWYAKQSSNGVLLGLQFGSPEDLPVPGDYNGDGRTDYALYRPSNGIWYVWTDLNGAYTGYNWGSALDIPVPGDYDGDGKTDYAIYRSNSGTWWWRKSSTNNSEQVIAAWGNYGDQPVPADYDGDGKADLAVWRPTNGVWYLLNSSDGVYNNYTFGSNSGMPVPSAYLKQVGGLVVPYDLAKARLSPKNATGGTDLYSRNFSWGTSLFGLSGRAGLNAGMGISYNSLVWTKQGSAMIFDTDSSNISPGFRFGFPVIEPGYYDAQTEKFAFLMVTPSGRRIEFKQSGASNLYETADSSYTQLQVNTSKDPNTGVVTVTLIVRGTDGTELRYVWRGGAYRCSQIKDTNGNFITVDHDDYGLLRTVTDTLGRVLTVNYDNQLYPVSITQNWQTNNGAGGTTPYTWATFSYANIALNPNFGTLAVYGPADNASVKVLQTITYPNGSITQFDYNSYGQVWKVRNHAANNDELNHTAVNLNAVSGAQTDCPRFTETRNYIKNFNLGNETVVTNSITENQNYTVGNNSGTGATLIQVSLAGHPQNAVSKTYVGATGWKEGLPLATEDWANSVRQRWTWTNWTQDDTTKTYILNPRTIESQVGDATNTKKTTVEYLLQPNTTIAQYGLVKEVKVYDTNQTTVLKRVTTDYNLGTAYTSRRIIGLPQKSELYDENNVQMSKVTYNYDEENFAQEPEQNIAPIQHDNTSFGTNFIVGRGNLTSTTRWDVNFPDNQSQAVTAKVRYDVAGSPVAQIDALNRKVKINYTDSFNDNQNRNSFAYPTKLTDPAGYFSEVKYRYDIGANVWAKSPAPAGNTSGKETTRLFDTFGRISKETLVNSGAYTRYEYPTNQIQSKIYSTITDTNNNGADTADEVLAESFTDGAGRVRQSRTELPNSTGGFSGQLTEYDLLGRVQKTTVPTEIDANWTPAGDDATRGWLWTYQEYDWKGRVTKTINTDGTDQLYSYDGCGCAGGQVTTVQGELVPRDDQPTLNARRTQKAFADILGRTYKTQVMNWDGSVYSTVINNFNGRDQATSVKQYQGAETSNNFQTTTQTYDGHGRFQTQHRPEQQNANGTPAFTAYNYNSDDSISTVMDARGATTNYVYNTRGLVEQISYGVPSNSPIPITPPVTFGYDNIGNRTQMTDGLGTVFYTYSQLSQMTSETRQFNDVLPNAPSNGFRLEYDYTLGGQLKSLKDPFGQQINYAFDKVGRLNAVSGQTAFGGVTNYANNPQYRAWGALKHAEYGDNATQMNVSFDNRLQPTGFEVVKAGRSDVIKQQYQYFSDGSLKHTLNETNYLFDRSYKYDFAGRLSAANAGEIADDPQSLAQPTYNQKYLYNPFGQMVARSGTIWDDDFSYNYNALTNAPLNDYVNNRVASSIYDAAGNVISSAGQSYDYAASGAMVENRDDANELKLDYDGTGQQIKRRARQKNISTGVWGAWETKYSINSSVIGGQVISEVKADGGKERTNIYAGNEVLAKQVQTAAGQYVGWKHSDPSGRTTDYTAVVQNNTGFVGRRTEMDPNEVAVRQSPRDTNFVPEALVTYNRSTTDLEAIQRGGCTLDGLPVSCSLAARFQEGGAAIPKELAHLQGRRGFSFEDRGLGIYSVSIPRQVGWNVTYNGVNDTTGTASPVYSGSYNFTWSVGAATQSQTRQQGDNTCGVNPVTNEPGIRDDKPDSTTKLRAGGLGNIRPGNGGNGGFQERKGQKHDATDIVAPVGTSTVANLSGDVVTAISGYKPANTAAKRTAQFGGLGNTIIINHGGFYTLYSHLTDVFVNVGDMVEEGQVIGTSGRTGNANNNQQTTQDDHVHFGVFSGPIKSNGLPVNKKQYQNPVTYLNSRCPPREGGGKAAR